MYDLIIIGAGASGLAAAVNAKRKNNELKIAIAEALDRVGKKILATGNGRCNLTNLNAEASCYKNRGFASYALEKYSPEKVIEFFRSMGLLCVSDSEGRVYPMSNTAASVLDCLRFEAVNSGVEFLTQTKISELEKKDSYFLINRKYKAKKVIISAGGKASPSQGSDGSGYQLLKSLGHGITATYPALVQLTVKEKSVKPLKGMRVKCAVTLYENDGIIDSSKGEVLFTDYGLSGIAIMDISRSVCEKECLCVLDMAPALSENELEKFIFERKSVNGSSDYEDILCGLLPRRVAQSVIKRANEPSAERLACIIKNFRFTVNGTRGFNNAQITTGGADVSEFDSHTMESKLISGLYCCGEILDVDSVCGGYNLQWAWASGLLAGESICINIPLA